MKVPKWIEILEEISGEDKNENRIRRVEKSAV